MKFWKGKKYLLKVGKRTFRLTRIFGEKQYGFLHFPLDITEFDYIDDRKFTISEAKSLTEERFANVARGELEWNRNYGHALYLEFGNYLIASVRRASDYHDPPNTNAKGYYSEVFCHDRDRRKWHLTEDVAKAHVEKYIGISTHQEDKQ